MIPAILNFLQDRYLLLRVIGAAAVAFVIVLVLAPRVIRFLMKRKLGDRPEFDREDLNKLTKDKANTPTMGGVLIVSAIMAAVLLFADLNNLYILISLFISLWLGVEGGFDDWLKLRRASGKGSRDGLKSWEKLLFQIGMVVLTSVFLWRYGSASVGHVTPAHTFNVPLVNWHWNLELLGGSLGYLVYTVIITTTIVGFSNAVNLTDGMDGLAAGCTMIVAAALAGMAYYVGVLPYGPAGEGDLPRAVLVPGAKEMLVLCGAMIGACLGFLWYNCHPAQVFMGDTGSLALGGLIGFVAVVIRQELLLLVAGFVFVMEAGSVMLQVSYFKLTKKGGIEGKRIFRCAPLHHHFHLGGWAESKVVVRFWILCIIFTVIAVSMLRLRLGG